MGRLAETVDHWVMEGTDQRYSFGRRARIWAALATTAVSVGVGATVAAQADAPGVDPIPAKERPAEAAPPPDDVRAAAESAGTASQAISVVVTPAE